MTERKDIGTEEVLYRLGLAAALTAAAVYMFLQLAPPAVREWLDRYSFCVIYRFTGFTCPGCGGTRAWTELLHGHIVRSALYHPLVLYAAVLYLLFMGSHTGAKVIWFAAKRKYRGMKWRDGYAVAAVVLLIANFIIKNLLHLFTGMDVLAELDRLFMS